MWGLGVGGGGEIVCKCLQWHVELHRCNPYVGFMFFLPQDSLCLPGCLPVCYQVDCNLIVLLCSKIGDVVKMM